MSRLAALGIKKVVGAAPAQAAVAGGVGVVKKRRLRSAASFPKGTGMTEGEEVDAGQELARGRINMELVGGQLPGSPGEMPSDGKKLSPLQRRMQNSKKEIMLITEAAAEMISSLLKRGEEETPQPTGVRVGLEKKGCNGLAYTMQYLYPGGEKQAKGVPGLSSPAMTTQHGITVLVEPEAFIHVVGTVMDYQVDKSSEKFVFLNPNSDGLCGCGKSFVPKAATA